MDTRITYEGSRTQPITDILPLYMKPTLFEEE